MRFYGILIGTLKFFVYPVITVPIYPRYVSSISQSRTVLSDEITMTFYSRTIFAFFISPLPFELSTNPEIVSVSPLMAKFLSETILNVTNP